MKLSMAMVSRVKLARSRRGLQRIDQTRSRTIRLRLARAEAKIADIEERIAQLDAMKRALAELVVQCRGEGPLSDCPILDALDEEKP